MDTTIYEPFIDKKTTELHYNYYETAKEKLNNLLNKNLTQDEVINIIKNIDTIDFSIRNEVLYLAGLVLNHELYFSNLGDHNYPSTTFSKILSDNFGNYEQFKNSLIDSGNNIIGSGYVFVVLNNNKLQIINTTNEENPYTYGFIPIIAIDMWEHAYYLKYNNNKTEYLNNVIEILNYEEIEKRYNQAIRNNK